MRPQLFDPLDYGSLSQTLADRLMQSHLMRLTEVEPFGGSGIYALFYAGDFPVYEELSALNVARPGTLPIYIGEAVPRTLKGSGYELVDESDSVRDRLYRRVCRDHLRSITKATNLELDDFSCKMLVLRPMWVPLAESALINAFAPVWNSVLPGFGNHDPGSGRAAGMLSDWDLLHPGRGLRGVLPEDPAAKVQAISQRVKHAIHERIAILGLDDAD